MYYMQVRTPADVGPFSSPYKVYANVSGWMTTAANGADVTLAFSYELLGFDLYVYNGVKYLKINSAGSRWNGYYLSVNKNGYLGLYSWSGACGWAMSGTTLVCCYNGQPVGKSSDNFLRAAPGMLALRFEPTENDQLAVSLA